MPDRSRIYGPLVPWFTDRRVVGRLPLALVEMTALGPVRRLPAATLEARLEVMGLGAERLARAAGR